MQHLKREPLGQSSVKLRASLWSNVKVPLPTGRPGAPSIRLLWRLHCILFAERTDPNLKSLRGVEERIGSGGIKMKGTRRGEGEREYLKDTEKSRVGM